MNLMTMSGLLGNDRRDLVGVRAFLSSRIDGSGNEIIGIPADHAGIRIRSRSDRRGIEPSIRAAGLRRPINIVANDGGCAGLPRKTHGVG